MTDTRVIPLSRIIVTSLWGAVLGLIVAMWGTMLAHSHGATHSLGYTACVLSAVATVAHIRCYAIRVLDVVRAIEDARQRERGGVHPVR